VNDADGPLGRSLLPPPQLISAGCLAGLSADSPRPALAVRPKRGIGRSRWRGSIGNDALLTPSRARLGRQMPRRRLAPV